MKRLAMWLLVAVTAVMTTASAFGQTSAPASKPATQPAAKTDASAAGNTNAAATIAPAAGTGATAGAAGSTTAEPWSEEWIKQIKNPTSWLSWGADFRARDEYVNNAATLNQYTAGHEMHYQRYRTRLWSTITPVEDLEINTRLAWEFRNWCLPKSKNEFNGDEVMWDNLNAKWKKAMGLPLTFTVGRQDIFDLSKWLLGEGTPLDGSRTAFFDAARMDLQFPDDKTSTTLIYIDDGSSANRWLPPFNSQNRPLIENDEQGAIAWLNHKLLKGTDVGGFFMYKHDEKVYAKGDNADIYTLGLRGSSDFTDKWRASGELAPQFGNKDGQDICALGFDGRLDYFVRDAYKNNLRMTYEFLSGDDPSTDTNESFDILWGRYARWSDIAPFLWQLETRPAQYTNLHRFGPGWTIFPVEKLEMCTDYYLMFADENTNAGSAKFSEDGLFRGQLVVWKLKYTFNPHISNTLTAEGFVPGSYYSSLANDAAVFLRYEIMLTW